MLSEGDFKKDNNLRGHSFEFVGKIMLRRKKKNNFIFQTSQFSHISELVDKYRLKFDSGCVCEKVKDILTKDKMRFDILEFVLDNKDNRLVKNMFFYDIKTFLGKEKRVEASLACFKQLNLLRKLGFNCFTFFIILKNDWSFDYYLKNYDFNSIKVYSRFKT